MESLSWHNPSWCAARRPLSPAPLAGGGHPSVPSRPSMNPLVLLCRLKRGRGPKRGAQPAPQLAPNKILANCTEGCSGLGKRNYARGAPCLLPNTSPALDSWPGTEERGGGLEEQQPPWQFWPHGAPPPGAGKGLLGFRALAQPDREAIALGLPAQKIPLTRPGQLPQGQAYNTGTTCWEAEGQQVGQLITMEELA